MRNQLNAKENLPIEDFKRLGLLSDNKVALSATDLKELTAGRRTSLLEFTNLEHEGIRIEKMKGKLSLKQELDGSFSLLVHPIYKEPKRHALLNDTEMAELINGTKESFTKEKQNKEKEIIEFDKETNQFVSVDRKNVIAPDKVNNQKLSEEMKEKLKDGERIELPDGTTLRISPTSLDGVQSNKAFLVMALAIDGEDTFIHVNPLEDRKNAQGKGTGKQPARNMEYSTGYLDALNEMKELKREKAQDLTISEQLLVGNEKKYSRSYTRGGVR